MSRDEIKAQLLKIGRMGRKTTGHGESSEVLEFEVDYSNSVERLLDFCESLQNDP